MRNRRERRRVSAKRWVSEQRTGGANFLKLPEGVERLEVDTKNSPYRFDFMPYVAGRGNPVADEGEEYFERTFYIHRNIGTNKEWHLCALKTHGNPCYICEYRAELIKSEDSDEQLIDDLKPSKRQLWLPRWLEQPDTIFVWEFSYHNFGRVLKNKIDASDEEDGYDFFYDPEEGFTLRVSFSKADAGNWLECTDIEFKPRRTKYPPEIADDAPCLDELLLETPYDKLKGLFLQTGEEESKASDRKGQTEQPRQERRRDDRPPREEKEEPQKPRIPTADEFGLEEGDVVKHPKFGRCEIRRISGDGTSLTLLDEDDDVHKGIGCDEVVRPKTNGKTEAKEEDPIETVEPEPASEPARASVGEDEPWDEDWDE